MRKQKRKIVLVTSAVVLGALGATLLASCGGSDTKVISFDAKDGTAVPDMEVEWGKEVAPEDLPKTTRTGYTFVNWCTDEAATTAYTTKKVEDNFTLYAKWEVASFTVHYFDSDGETKLYDDALVQFSGDVDLKNPTKDNNTFAGWYTTSTFEEGTKLGNAYKMPAKDVNLYASWVSNYYDVTFNINYEGGVGQMDPVRIKTSDAEHALPACSFARTGYVFAGWNTKADGTGDSFNDKEVITNIPASGPLALYAQWTPNNYVISFYSNNSLLKDLELHLDYGADLVIPDEEKYTCTLTGFEFKGWGKLAEYAGETFDKKNNYLTLTDGIVSTNSLAKARQLFDAGETLYVVSPLNGDKVTGTTSLYAIYERAQYTVTFDVDGGTARDPIQAYYGETVSLGDATKQSYRFDGWFIGEEKVASVEIGAQNVEVKAKWTEVSTVKFYYMDGEDKVYYEGEDIILETGTNIPSNSAIDNFAKKKGYTPSYNGEASYTSLVVTSGEMEILITYTANEYGLTLNANGGVFANDATTKNIDLDYGKEFTTENGVEEPVRTGYTFKGWYFDTDFENKAIKMDDEHEDIYAKWEINEYSIKFNSNGGEPVDDLEADYNSDISSLAPKAVRTHYKFLGWYTSLAEDAQKYTFDKMPLGGVEMLYAKWQIKPMEFESEGVKLYELAKYDENAKFMDYIESIYNQYVTYNYIYNALNDIVVSSGSNNTEFTRIGTYAQMKQMYLTGQLTDEMIDQYPQTAALVAYYGCTKLEAAYVQNLISSSLASGVEEAIGYYETLEAVPFESNLEFYTTLMTVTSGEESDLKNAVALVSINRMNSLNEYEFYEENAYNPQSNKENHYFYDWTEIDDEDVVRKVATYSYKLPIVGGYTEEHTYNTVTFSWDPVLNDKNEIDDNCFGYEVTITRNGVEGEPFVIPGVENTSHPVTGLAEKEIVNIQVVALFKDATKELGYTTESKAFEATSIATGADIQVESYPIASEPSSFTYTNREASSINFDNITAGEYYYVDKDEGRLYFFTSGTYNFANTEISVVGGDASLVTIEGTSIKTSTKTGGLEIQFKTPKEGAEGEYDINVYSVTISPLYQKSEFGNSYKEYDAATLTTDITLDQTKGDYLDADGIKDVLKVGRGVSHVGSVINNAYQYADYQTYVRAIDTYYSNGIYLDIASKSTNGSVINNLNFKYDVKIVDYNGEGTEDDYILVPDTDYYYDSENNILYLLESANYDGELEISVTPSVTDNIYVPKAIIDLIKAKPEQYTVSFTVEVNDGFNAYSSHALRQAYGDLNVTEINILRSFEAKLEPNMVAPAAYLKAHYLEDDVLDYDTNPHGEVDIVDDTAYLATVYSGYVGPKYRPATESDTFKFRAYYLNSDEEYTIGSFTYDPSGSYYIHHGAEWEQNITDGAFKIVNAAAHLSASNKWHPLGLTPANIYDREGLATENLTINGNYFTIDGSKLPCVISNGHVTAGSAIAEYNIQHSVCGIFSNDTYDSTAVYGVKNAADIAVSNLTLYGNTSNTSKYFVGSDQDLKAEMELRSGGANGFATRVYTWSSREEATDPANQVINSFDTDYSNGSASFTLTNVNVYDTLIALYIDASLNASYVRIDNTWANSLYSHVDEHPTMVNIDHTAIGSSGGAALDMEDKDKAYNPSLNVDYSTTVIDNFINGEEPWFKGYNMEVVALGLKGQFEQLVQGITTNSDFAAGLAYIDSQMGGTGAVTNLYKENGYTLIKTDEVAGKEYETMNFVFFGKSDDFKPDEKDFAVIEGMTDFYTLNPLAAQGQIRYITQVAGTYAGIDYQFIFDLAGEHHYFFAKTSNDAMGVIQLMIEIFAK